MKAILLAIIRPMERTNTPTCHPPPLETRHLSPVTRHLSLTTRHPSLVTDHPSPVTRHPSPVTRHSSPVTRHASRVTRHLSRVTNHPLSSRSLLQLTLLSTFIFIFSALLIQFLLTLISAIFLNVYAITFQYSLFAINFLSETFSNPLASEYSSQGNIKWSEGQIYVIFGLGPLLLFALGFLVLFILKKYNKIGWKIKLILTWIAFLLVHTLPCGIIAGVFFYDGFGVAFQWMVTGYMGRGIIAFAVLLILLVFSRFWQRLFFKAANTSAFFGTGRHQRVYIKTVFFKPWMYGFLMLLFFNLPFNNFYWRAFLLSFGYMAVLLIDRSSHIQRHPHIRKSRKKIFTSRYQPLYFALALVLIWVADYIIMNF